MRSAAVVLLVAMGVFCSPTTIHADEISDLILKLNDRDSSVRQGAFDQLRTIGEPARSQLLKAAQSEHPAVAESAQSLIMRLPWSRPGDSPALRRMLRSYGSAHDIERARILSDLIASPDAALQDAGMRVLTEEPSEFVAWQATSHRENAAAWDRLEKTIDLAVARPSLVHLVAWRKLKASPDSDEALKLLTQCLASELRQPTAGAQHLSRSVKLLQKKAKTYSEQLFVLKCLRHLVMVVASDDQAESMTADILLLQARIGPLPGFADDLRLEWSDPDPRPLLALAHMARRFDATLPAQMLENVTLQRCEESDPDARTNQLLLAASYLEQLTNNATAEQALLRAASLETIPARLGQVNLLLFNHYSTVKRHDAAADRLELALQQLGPEAAVIVGGARAGVGWSRTELEAIVAFERLKHAVQQQDTEAVARLASVVANRAAGDMDFFLKVLPDLETHVSREAIDGFFERSYVNAKKHLDELPDDAVRLNDLAWLCARAGRRLDEALDYAQQATEKEPNNAALLDTLAEVKFRLGKYDEAVAIEQRVVQMRPDDEFLQEQLTRFRAATQPAK